MLRHAFVLGSVLEYVCICINLFDPISDIGDWQSRITPCVKQDIFDSSNETSKEILGNARVMACVLSDTAIPTF